MNGPSNDSPAVTTRNRLERTARNTEPAFQRHTAGRPGHGSEERPPTHGIVVLPGDYREPCPQLLTEEEAIRHRSMTMKPSVNNEFRRSIRSLDDLRDPCPSEHLAVALARSPKTVVDWCQEREYTLLPCFKIGNRWFHRIPEVKRWLKGIQSGQVEFRRKPRQQNGR